MKRLRLIKNNYELFWASLTVVPIATTVYHLSVEETNFKIASTFLLLPAGEISANLITRDTFATCLEKQSLSNSINCPVLLTARTQWLWRLLNLRAHVRLVTYSAGKGRLLICSLSVTKFGSGVHSTSAMVHQDDWFWAWMILGLRAAKVISSASSVRMVLEPWIA